MSKETIKNILLGGTVFTENGTKVILSKIQELGLPWSFGGVFAAATMVGYDLSSRDIDALAARFGVCKEPPKPTTCEWKWIRFDKATGKNLYRTGCDKCGSSTERSNEQGDFKSCPFCGGTITEVE